MRPVDRVFLVRCLNLKKKEEKKLGFERMDGGKACSDIQQADQVKTTEGMSREERLDLYIASFTVRSIFHWDDDADLSGPHKMTMREFASMQLDDIEHGNFDLEVDYSNIIDCSAVLRFYDPTENIMASETELTELMECSSQAIGEYNNTNGTHFQVVRVLKANVEVLSPYGYYITFEANDATQNITQSFQAMVAVCIPTTKRLVQLVQIRKPLEPFCP